MSTKREDWFDATEASPWMRPFVPRRFLSNGYLQTIVGNFLPRTYSLPEPESQLIEVEAATSDRETSFVLCHCHWQPAEVLSERLTMVMIHELEGSSSSPYVLGNSARAWIAGCNVVRMNMRSCGAGEQLSPSIYHAGRSEDVAIVMAELARSLHDVAPVKMAAVSTTTVRRRQCCGLALSRFLLVLPFQIVVNFRRRLLARLLPLLLCGIPIRRWVALSRVRR